MAAMTLQAMHADPPGGLAGVERGGEAVEQPVSEDEQGDDGDPAQADHHAAGVDGAAVKHLREEQRGHAEVDDVGHHDGQAAGDRRGRVAGCGGAAEQAQQYGDEQAADQDLHGDEVQCEGDDVEEFEQPDGGWQGDGIDVRKTIHLRNPSTHNSKIGLTQSGVFNHRAARGQSMAEHPLLWHCCSNIERLLGGGRGVCDDDHLSGWHIGLGQAQGRWQRAAWPVRRRWRR